jgi:peptidoglycan/LPS O-acetylase OafA/YrhL
MSPVNLAAESDHKGRIEVLDLLRLVAVLAVVIYHYAFRGAAADGYTTVSLSGIEGVAKYGYLGVQFFFIISGFVIAYSAEGRSAANFAIARFARIYPGFLVCMTVTFLVSLAIGGPRFAVSLPQWLGNLLIVSPAVKQPFMDGAYWSIVYEITFYGWVFLLASLTNFRRNIEWIVIAWLAISMLNIFLIHSGVMSRLFLTDQSGFFVEGLLLYEIYKGRRDVALYLLLALAAAISIDQAFIGAIWVREHFHIQIDNIVIAAVCLAALGSVALSLCVRRMPLPAPVLLAVGGLTYPMYLLHQHIGFMLLNRFEGRASATILIGCTMVLMLAASWLVWRLVERPAQKRLKRMLTAGHQRFSESVAPIQRGLQARLADLRASRG